MSTWPARLPIPDDTNSFGEPVVPAPRRELSDSTTEERSMGDWFNAAQAQYDNALPPYLEDESYEIDDEEEDDD